MVKKHTCASSLLIRGKLRTFPGNPATGVVLKRKITGQKRNTLSEAGKVGENLEIYRNSRNPKSHMLMSDFSEGSRGKILTTK